MTQRNKEFKLARNYYVRIQREEKNHKKYIVNKCKTDTKLFYRYINQTIKNKENVTRLKVNNIYMKS